MRTIADSTKSFEDWLKARTDVSGKLFSKLLDRKHKKMAKGAFPFLRATFYRWAEQWPEVCPRLAKRVDDVLLSVSDLHVENFGTWIDSREHLVWGINDFDEACEMPFTNDLVRLTTSAILGTEENHLVTAREKIPRLIMEGYVACLDKGGAPIVLDNPGAQFPFVLPPGLPEDAVQFWQEELDEDDSPVVSGTELSAEVVTMFRAAFPSGAELEFRRQEKPGGLGSLGRGRYTAVYRNEERLVAREVKRLLPSALYWTLDLASALSQTASLLQRAIRDPDPFVSVHDSWLLRQRGPETRKIEMAKLPDTGREEMELNLFRAMGWETANVHLGSRGPKFLQLAVSAVTADEGASWLSDAANNMAESTRLDFLGWTKPS